MDSRLPDTDKIAAHWDKSSDDDHDTMMVLYGARSYHWALFLGHIAVEKALKARYVERHGQHAPFTHNLYRLAELCGLEPDEQQAEQLFRITAFNINGRYDDYKREFQAMCTPEFAAQWTKNITEIRKWIRQKQ